MENKTQSVVVKNDNATIATDEKIPLSVQFLKPVIATSIGALLKPVVDKSPVLKFVFGIVEDTLEIATGKNPVLD